MALSKVQAAIIVMLGTLGQKVHRTRLVKLIYLADNTFYELNGKTLTGLSYVWDSYGPNAISNAIVKEADLLAHASLINMAVQPSIYGNDAHLYWTSEDRSSEALTQFSAGEIQVLRDTVKKYGAMSIRSIVGLSKKTKPFQQAKQYGILNLRLDPRADALQQRVKANKQFMAVARRGIKDIALGRLTDQDALDRLHKERA